jgi:hypothetical protein
MKILEALSSWKPAQAGSGFTDSDVVSEAQDQGAERSRIAIIAPDERWN